MIKVYQLCATYISVLLIQIPKEDYLTICNHQADNPCYVWSDVWSGDLQA